MKTAYLLALAALLMLPCTTEAKPSAPAPIGYEGYNSIATEHLKDALNRTATITICLKDQQYPLTAAETAALLNLLEGVKSSAPTCAPEDCIYMNLDDASGSWLASLPAQVTQEGLVLLYLKLAGNNAGAPLQNWWQGVTTRLGL